MNNADICGVRRVAALALFLTLLAYAGEKGFYIYEHPGYDNTPRIPGSKYHVHQKDRPQPPRVIPPPAVDFIEPPPPDANILFDGNDLDKFVTNHWKVKDGVVIAGHGDLVTKESFGDCQLHIEWKTPNPPWPGNTRFMGNSGVFFMKQYELQIFDSYSCKIHADGSAASIYGQTPPLVNACRKPGEWQTFDVTFKAPVFRDGHLVSPARITVLHNSILVHKNTKIYGPTGHKMIKPYKVHPAKMPLRLQGTGQPVEFRNIWIRELKLRD